jgi:hypothetical protein
VYVFTRGDENLNELYMVWSELGVVFMRKEKHALNVFAGLQNTKDACVLDTTRTMSYKMYVEG